jgi:hypothetical protein
MAPQAFALRNFGNGQLRTFAFGGDSQQTSESVFFNCGYSHGGNLSGRGAWASAVAILQKQYVFVKYNLHFVTKSGIDGSNVSVGESWSATPPSLTCCHIVAYHGMATYLRRANLA